MTRSVPRRPVSISLGEGCVSGVLDLPPEPEACYVMAHGAGAGMEHPFLAAVAGALAGHGIATLRFQFPFMERGSRRPDPPAVAQEAVRAAVAAAGELVPFVPLVAGGRSFGGRMASAAQARAPLPGVQALVFLGFPLHPANRPSTERAAHLVDVERPMLFVQGERDALAERELIVSTCDGLGSRATLHLVPEADHGFRVPARTGRTQADVIGEIAGTVAMWVSSRVGRGSEDPRPPRSA